MSRNGIRGPPSSRDVPLTAGRRLLDRSAPYDEIELEAYLHMTEFDFSSLDDAGEVKGTLDAHSITLTGEQFKVLEEARMQMQIEQKHDLSHGQVVESLSADYLGSKDG